MGLYLSKVTKTILSSDDFEDERSLVVSFKGMPESAQFVKKAA